MLGRDGSGEERPKPWLKEYRASEQPGGAHWLERARRVSGRR